MVGQASERNKVIFNHKDNGCKHGDDKEDTDDTDAKDSPLSWLQSLQLQQ